MKARSGACDQAGARDQAGHYAMLDIATHATAEEVTAAYRRAAKRLHPDMPGTGDRAAFLRLQEAYQVLGNPMRRAAYDQEARADWRPSWRQEDQALGFIAPISWRLPPYFRLAMLVLTVLALGQVGWRFYDRAPAEAARPMALASAPPGQATVTPAHLTLALPEPSLPGDHFIGPGSTPVVLWGRAPDRVAPLRIGQLATFTPITVLALAGADGLAEIRTATGQAGWVEAARLQRGDARAARQAACLYHAGPTPRGGQPLIRPQGGNIRVTVENHADRPAVFKLRDAGNAAAAAIYLAPNSQAEIENLPAGPYRGEFAVGDLWSVPCGIFLAGMRAHRLPDIQTLHGPARFILPTTMPGEDIADDVFSRD